MITHMDTQIGRILDKLDESGQAENTYIIFTTDHGLAVGQHGLLDKQSMYDHSVRVPLVVSGPGIKPNHQIDEFVYLQVVVPPALEIAGVGKPDHHDRGIAAHFPVPFLRMGCSHLGTGFPTKIRRPCSNTATLR